MIGMGAKASTIVRAVSVDFFFDCWAVEVPQTLSSLEEWALKQVLRTGKHIPYSRKIGTQIFSAHRWL
jgi:hypothetical protein